MANGVLTTPCKSCGAPIVWITKNPSADGQRVKHYPCNPKLYTIITDDGQLVKGRESHFSDCPNAAQHRKKKGGAE